MADNISDFGRQSCVSPRLDQLDQLDRIDGFNIDIYGFTRGLARKMLNKWQAAFWAGMLAWPANGQGNGGLCGAPEVQKSGGAPWAHVNSLCQSSYHYC